MRNLNDYNNERNHMRPLDHAKFKITQDVSGHQESCKIRYVLKNNKTTATCAPKEIVQNDMWRKMTQYLSSKDNQRNYIRKQTTSALAVLTSNHPCLTPHVMKGTKQRRSDHVCPQLFFLRQT